MITLLRNGQRHHVRRGKQEVWHSFLAEDHLASLHKGFGFLFAFDELRIQPNTSTEPRFEDETEIVTYVHKGALSQENTLGNSGMIHTGEFQRMSTGRRIRHKETSVSRTDSVHLFRASVQSAQAGLVRGHEQKRFTEAQRHNLLCVVVSPDGRQGSLRIHQDVLVCSAILDPGHHLVHELAPGRTAWLHVVCGEATHNDIVLTQGDGVGFTNERSVSLTVRENTEILLIDLGPTNLRPWEKQSHGTDARAPRGGL
jgi:redox-sensitive bicupin YhaK (pirin superfamily)